MFHAHCLRLAGLQQRVGSPLYAAISFGRCYNGAMQIFSTTDDVKLVNLLLRGGIGVLPTDTVYGLVACVKNHGAIERMYRLKQRARQPGTIIAADIEQLESIGFRPDELQAVKKVWPGAVSVSLSSENVPAYVGTKGERTSVRIPDHDNLMRLLIRTGPLMTTSANHPGEPTAVTMADAQRYFGDLVDFYVEGGDLSGRLPSTIVMFDDSGNPEVIRQGAGIVTG